VTILRAVTDEEAAQKFPAFEMVNPYLRTTAQPS